MQPASARESYAREFATGWQSSSVRFAGTGWVTCGFVHRGAAGTGVTPFLIGRRGADSPSRERVRRTRS